MSTSRCGISIPTTPICIIGTGTKTPEPCWHGYLVVEALLGTRNPKTPPGLGPGVFSFAPMKRRSVLRDDRRIEVVVDAGAEDVLGNRSVRRRRNGAENEGIRRGAEIDVEIF